MNTLPNAFNDECRKLLTALFDWLVQPCIDYIRHECKLFVTTSPLHLVHSLMCLYTCLLDEVWLAPEDDSSRKMPQTQLTLWIQCIFMFALVWSVGGTMTGDSRKKFDVFFRTLVSGTDQDYPRPKIIKLAKSNLFPDRGTIYDFFFQKIGGIWSNWEDLLEKGSTIPASAKASELIIPTVDTARQKFFLDTFINREEGSVPMLFVGPTGTGKSAITNNYIVQLPKDK